MLKLFLSALWSGFLALIGLQKKDPEVEEAKNAQSQAEYGEKVLSQPDHDKPAVVADFRMHAKGD